MMHIFKGKDIILRKPQKEDILQRVELGLNGELVKMCGLESEKHKTLSMIEAESWYERICNHPCKWIIEYNGKMIGTISLRINQTDNKGKLAIEIYEENLYGKGLETQAIKLVLDYSFKELNLHKIYLRVLDYNTRGIACYKKCGFIIEGYDREDSFINDKYVIDVYMSILKTEYR